MTNFFWYFQNFCSKLCCHCFSVGSVFWLVPIFHFLLVWNYSTRIPFKLQYRPPTFGLISESPSTRYLLLYFRHLTSRVQVGSPAIMRVLKVPDPVLEGKTTYKYLDSICNINTWALLAESWQNSFKLLLPSMKHYQ